MRNINNVQKSVLESEKPTMGDQVAILAEYLTMAIRPSRR